MHCEGNTCNGSTEQRSLSAERTEELKTYKRRKHSRPCTGVNGHHDGSFSATESHLLSNKTANLPRNDVLVNNVNKIDEHAGIDSSVIQICVDDSMRGHWEKVLEQMLQSTDVSEGGIQNCVQYALASSTSGFISNCAAQRKIAHEMEPICFHGDGHTKHQNQLPGESQKPNGSVDAGNEHRGITSDRSHEEPKDQTDARSVTECCRSVFLDVIVSDKFASLCNLLCSNFQGIKVDSILDTTSINSRMERGQYEESSELFALDIQKVWKKFEEIGKEMVSLAKGLSTISRNSYCKQVGESVHGAIGEWKDEDNNQVGMERKDSLALITTKQVPSSVADTRTKPEQSEHCGLNIFTCKHCGAEADGKRRLICDQCEAIYHISCINPPVEDIPNRSWYCAVCSANGKESPQADSTHSHGEILHQDCVVCERLKSMGTQACDGEICMETVSISDDSGEASDSSTEDDRTRESRRIITSRLCKLCKTGEEDGKRFVICQHKHCPYKYYHRRCLSYKQIRCFDGRWYCPSCLCRACLIDKDDDKIVLCDGCDEAHHTYCMVPPRTTIPRGHWYCMFCMIEIRARRRLELRAEASVDKRMKKIATKENGSAGGSVDMLLSAAEKLNSER